MAQQPIYNPIIPFTGTIMGGLQDGKMVIIQGQVPGHAKRFGVDFQCGSCVMPRADVAFHLNIRYDESAVVCNTLDCQRWGSEERNSHVPINAGSYFELIIKSCYTCFQVSVNGQHFLEYRHRLPMTRVDTLKVSGDVHVNAITFKEPDVPPAYAPPAYGAGHPFASNFAVNYCAPPTFSMPAKPAFNVMPKPNSRNRRQKSTPAQVTVSNPVVPYQAYMGALRPQQLIKIVGTVNTNPKTFNINLKAKYTDNIALHIGQRYAENAVVRNSRIHQKWGTEERALPFLPFVPGQTFEMQIIVQPSCYKILVNGRHLFNYNHRLQPLNQIDELEVVGDISLSLVQY